MNEKQRVIFEFENGKRRYAINNGIPEKWGRWELSVLTNRFNEFQPAYTSDLKTFAIDHNELLKLGYTDLIRIKSFTTEPVSEPIKPELVY